ncbi:MAG: hypothetical protein ACLTXT_01760 [Ruminococcus callidus]
MVSMGNGVFQNCSGLKTVKFRSMEFSEIPDDTFSGCTSRQNHPVDTTTRIGKEPLKTLFACQHRHPGDRHAN